MRSPFDRLLRGLQQRTWEIHHHPEDHNTPESDIEDLRVSVKSPEDAQLLHGGLGAGAGELAAISQYMYHFALFPLPLQHMIMAIAQREMHHLRLFARAVVLAGGDPCYVGSDGVPYSTALVTYDKLVPAMLATDLKSEEAAISLYRQIQAGLVDENLKIMVERIIADEQRHAEEFGRALETYRRNGDRALPIDVSCCPYTDEPATLYCGPPQTPRPGLDPAYARTLLPDLAGPCSHYSESTQYYYQAFISEDDAWLKNNLLTIAMEENHHIHQTQLVIRWLGMDPVFVDASGRFWSAAMLDYSRAPAQFLRRDIALEQARIADIKTHLATAREPFVTRQLSAIPLEEERHLRVFSDAAARYGAAEPSSG